MNALSFARIALFLGLLAPFSALRSQVTPPVTHDFEAAEGFTLGNLNGQQSWVVDQGQADVINTDSAVGTQSVHLLDNSPFTQVRLPLTNPGGQSIVFTSFYLKPYASDLTAKDEFLDLGSSLVGFFKTATNEGKFYAYDGSAWVAVDLPIALDANDIATSWIEVTLRQDFTSGSKEWDLYLGSELFLANLGYVDPLVTFPTDFLKLGHTGGDSYLDNVRIAFTNTLAADQDKDGMPDAFEDAYGTDKTLDDRNGDIDNDSLTNIEDYATGDADGDQLSDSDELFYFSSLLEVAGGDFDNDGLTNGVELAHGLNPAVADSFGSGALLRSIWRSIGGGAVINLTDEFEYPDNPDHITYIGDLDTGDAFGELYGQRISGLLHAPVTGDYTFWIAANQTAELWLSTDSDEANLVKIAEVTSATNPNDYDAAPGQQSASISLVAGQTYYIQILQAEQYGGDHVSVAWTLPADSRRLITRHFLSPDARVSGDVLVETWFDIDTGVSDLVADPDYPNNPDVTSYHLDAKRPFTNSSTYDDIGTRIRGWVHPPETGTYTLYVSAGTSAELYLGSDPQSATLAATTGISYIEDYEKFTSQASAPQSLTVGVPLYFEIRHHSGEGIWEHASLGWLRPGETYPELVTKRYVSAYTDSADSDYDGLPDSWETTHSLDTASPIDALADSDGDGLDNLREYRSGANPTLANSDSDAFDDLAEFIAGTDPTDDQSKPEASLGAWTQSSIGNASGATYALSNGDLRLSATATGFGYSTDHIQFVHQSVTGDFQLSARVLRFDNELENFSSELGISARSNATANNAAHFSATLNYDSLLNYNYRPTDGGNRSAASLGLIGEDEPDIWVRVQRIGDTFRIARSIDGLSWEVVHEEDLSLSAQLEVGFSFSSWSAQAAGLAHLSDVELLVDADGDGLLDAWEQQIIDADPGDGIVTIADVLPGDDFDNDGLTNLVEFLNGTDPTVAEVVGEGYLLRELWNVGGSSVSNLTSYADYPDKPEHIDYVEQLCCNQYLDELFGARYSGWVHAPASGDYTFWIAANQSAELWLSTDASAANLVKVAEVTSATADQDFDANPEQQSVTISLSEGQQYYLQVLHKEQYGADHVSVAWQIPNDVRSVISDNFLSPEARVSGEVMVETYDHIVGDLSTLQGDPDFPSNPDRIDYHLDANRPFTDRVDDIGSRIRGWVLPPETGTYTLYVSAGTSAELYTGTDAASATLTASTGITWVETWDKFPEQASAPISLTAGTPLYFEIQHHSGSGIYEHASLGWLRPGATEPELITQKFISVYTDTADSDYDGMPDSWEISHSLNPASPIDALLDQDADGLNNLEEYRHSTDPGVADSDADGFSDGDEVLAQVDPTDALSAPESDLGAWSLGTIGSLVESPAAYRTADALHLEATALGSGYNADELAILYQSIVGDFTLVARISSYDNELVALKASVLLTARESLDAGGAHVSLSLSDAGYYDEQLRNTLNGDAETRGIEYFGKDPDNHWLRLERKGSAFIHSSSSDGLTWAQDFVVATELPTALHVGLALASNSQVYSGVAHFDNISLRVDTDQDGLYDDEEAQLGTDPLNPDSDADGILDGVEVHEMFTDPLVDEGLTLTSVLQVDGSAVTQTDGEWSTFGNLVYSNSINGSITYDISVATAGAYEITFTGFPYIGTNSSDTFDLSLRVDGSNLGRKWLQAPIGGSDTVSWLVPKLAAGSHTIELQWHNVDGGVSLAIERLDVDLISGADTDSNGVDDWLEGHLSVAFGVDNLFTASRVSPYNLRGHAQYVDEVGLSSTTNSVTVQETVHAYLAESWHADMALQAGYITDFTLDYFGGALSEQYQVDWQLTDLIQEDGLALDVRKGDSLLVGSNDVNLDPLASIAVDLIDLSTSTTVSTWSLAFGQEQVVLLDTAGDYKLQAQGVEVGTGNPLVGEVFVSVYEADLGADRILHTSFPKAISVQISDETVVLEQDSWVGIQSTGVAGDYQVALNRFAVGLLSARLPGDGSILDTMALEPTFVSTTNNTFHRIGERFSDGTVAVVFGISVQNLPPDAQIEVSVNKAGVMFEDGTTVKIFTLSDVNEYGFIEVRLLVPGEGIAPCHTIRVYSGGEEIAAF